MPGGWEIHHRGTGNKTKVYNTWNDTPNGLLTLESVVCNTNGVRKTTVRLDIENKIIISEIMKRYDTAGVLISEYLYPSY